MLRTLLVASVMLASGCYLSHEPLGEGGVADLGRRMDAGPPTHPDPCSCERASDESSCGARAGCTWMFGDGCGRPPIGAVDIPICEALHGACTTNADCASSDTCVTYYVNPCRGASCDACGGTEKHCTTLCFRPD